MSERECVEQEEEEIQSLEPENQVKDKAEKCNNKRSLKRE